MPIAVQQRHVPLERDLEPRTFVIGRADAMGEQHVEVDGKNILNGEGVTWIYAVTKDAAGNADYDQAAALDLPPLPSPPDLPAPPAPQSPAIAQKAVIDKPVSAPESLHMQMRPGGVADGDVFLARVRAHLAHYRQALPPDLRTARGTTLLRFTVDADGAVHAASVAASSGNAALDRQAMALLQRAQPLPHRAGAITLTVPVEFGAGAAD